MFVTITLCIEIAEECLYCLRAERFIQLTTSEQLERYLCGLPEETGRRQLLGLKYNNTAVIRQSPFSITAPGCLRNGIQASHGPVDYREINIHTGFNQLGADDAQRRVRSSLAIRQFATNLRQDLGPVFCAHIGG